MKKSTVIADLSVILLLAALATSFNTVRTSRSFLDCASRMASEAPPSDRLQPDSFHRLTSAFGVHDMYLSRVIANECVKDPGTAPGRFGRRLAALVTLK